MKKEKLWIITELFYPEKSSTAYILTEIAEALSEKYDIHVLCGNPVYDNNAENSELKNITVHRLDGKKIDKDNKIERIFRAFTLSYRLCNLLDLYKNDVDKVIAVTNPVFLVLNVSKWCKENHKEFILLVHDLFPENAIATKIIKNHWFGNLLKKRFDKAYCNCSKIIACGNDMKDVIDKKVNGLVHVQTITNWADCDKIVPIDRDDKSKIIIQFAGNLGRVQGVEEFIKIIKNVHNVDIKFVFRGSGAVKEKIEILIKKLKLENIEIYGKYDRSEENKILNNCDIALVLLNNAMFGLGVPSKTYNNMAAGKPILFVGPKNSEIYNEVNNNDIGYAFSFDDKQKIIDFLENLSLEDKALLKGKGLRAKQRAFEVYSKEKILKEYKKNI